MRKAIRYQICFDDESSRFYATTKLFINAKWNRIVGRLNFNSLYCSLFLADRCSNTRLFRVSYAYMSLQLVVYETDGYFFAATTIVITILAATGTGVKAVRALDYFSLSSCYDITIWQLKEILTNRQCLCLFSWCLR